MLFETAQNERRQAGRKVYTMLMELDAMDTRNCSSNIKTKLFSLGFSLWLNRVTTWPCVYRQVTATTGVV